MKKMYSISGLVSAAYLALSLGSSSSAMDLPSVQRPQTEESYNGKEINLPKVHGGTIDGVISDNEPKEPKEPKGCWIIDIDFGIVEIRYESPGCRKSVSPGNNTISCAGGIPGIRPEPAPVFPWDDDAGQYVPLPRHHCEIEGASNCFPDKNEHWIFPGSTGPYNPVPRGNISNRPAHPEELTPSDRPKGTTKKPINNVCSYALLFGGTNDYLML